MNGLEQILLKIEEDNNQQIKQTTDAILAEGKAQATEITADAKKQADKIISDAEKKAAQILESAKGGCIAAAARRLMAAKSEIINESVLYSSGQLKAMPDKEYFSALHKLILKYAHPESGELILNSRDAERLPKDFVDTVNNELKKINGSITLSDKCADIDSGFILRYGGIDENCTFDALIKENADKIKDALLRELKEV